MFPLWDFIGFKIAHVVFMIHVEHLIDLVADVAHFTLVLSIMSLHSRHCFIFYILFIAMFTAQKNMTVVLDFRCSPGLSACLLLIVNFKVDLPAPFLPF